MNSQRGGVFQILIPCVGAGGLVVGILVFYEMKSCAFLSHVTSHTLNGNTIATTIGKPLHYHKESSFNVHRIFKMEKSWLCSQFLQCRGR